MAKRSVVAPEALKESDRRQDIGPVPSDADPWIERPTTDSPEHQERIRRVELRQKFVTISDQIANETLFVRTHKWPHADEIFPEAIDADWRYVAKFYPYTKDGKPLYVDEPRTKREVERSYKKQELFRNHPKLKKLGIRFVVIEADATLDTCLEQLGEL